MSGLKFTIVGFDPDWSVHPGATLKELLAEWGITQSELALAIGVSQKHISEVINDKAGIGTDFAMRLEDVTHVDALFWVRMQAAHDLWRARQNEVAA
ncbi:MAG: HigA family addiction module antitoxin [Actinomycetota bacterium]|nr:HigA family addiction module antitoxin [Actinomycetota bacterium]